VAFGEPDRGRQDAEVQAPLILPRRATAALVARWKRQAAERLAAGSAWQGSNLVFRHEDGRMYSKDALNWRFGKMTRRAGTGYWHVTKDGTPCTGT
jgi:hypothetical protein